MKKFILYFIFVLIGTIVLFSFQSFGKSFKSNISSPANSTFIENNFQDEPSQYLLIDGSDTVVFDFSQALCTSSMIQVPVFILSDEPVYALDFDMKFNPSEFSYNSFVSHQVYLNNAGNYQLNDSTFRFTSFSMVPMDNNIPLISLQFNVPSGVLNISSFSLIRSWLNGDLCSYKSINLPPSPPIVPGGITNIQSGDSLLLSISLPAGYTNVWSNGSTDSFIYVSTAGTFSVIVTNNLGCTATSFITVTVISPLPVELLFFDGVVEDNSIKIYWSTGSEVNNNYFGVERSDNGIEWTTIAQVDGNGSTNNISNYYFVDTDPQEGDNYYRLRQVDFNGDHQYSKTIGLQFEKNKKMLSGISIYPNPSRPGSQDVVISIKGYENAGTIKINDYNGREVYSYPVLISGLNQMDNDAVQITFTKKLNPGIYVIRYITDDQSSICKWVIQ